MAPTPAPSISWYDSWWGDGKIFQSSIRFWIHFLIGRNLYQWSTIHLPIDVWLVEMSTNDLPIIYQSMFDLENKSTNDLPINLPIDVWSDSLKSTCFGVPAIRPNSSRFVLTRPNSSRFVLIRFKRSYRKLYSHPRTSVEPGAKFEPQGKSSIILDFWTELLDNL